jgi:DNA invertase Pin-like site-specific DNA recombinase
MALKIYTYVRGGKITTQKKEIKKREFTEEEIQMIKKRIEEGTTKKWIIENYNISLYMLNKLIQ